MKISYYIKRQSLALSSTSTSIQTAIQANVRPSRQVQHDDTRGDVIAITDYLAHKSKITYYDLILHQTPVINTFKHKHKHTVSNTSKQTFCSSSANTTTPVPYMQ